MARQINKLKALTVKQTKQPGWYPDGMGLYLQVSPTLSKSWVYRYEMNGKERRHGLGSYPTHSLEDAREAAKACRRLRKNGIDPIEYSQELKTQRALEKAKGVTFSDCAEKYIETHKSSWKNAKHAQQWENTLDTYAKPVIGDLSVQDVDVGLILQILEPIWNKKTETATRVRQRIESILDWATARGYRDGENPARWRGHLDKLLPRRSKVQKVIHHPAMPYSKVPQYYQGLRKQETIAARALAFIILTAARSGEARGSSWDEIDLDAGVWTLPPERMKAGRQHRVPLTKEAIHILEQVKPYSQDSFVFPGMKKGKGISEAALRKHLKDTHPDLTIHGFRSSFRDWCAEQTSYPREVAEAALAHVVRDRTEAAYQRGDMFERRRKLMESWSRHCATAKAGKVVGINKNSRSM
ncbi:MAG: integrase arm-type DNA-binding domain-containing protein [Sedimenticola sp.]